MASPIEDAMRAALLRCVPVPWQLVDATGHPSRLDRYIEPCIWLEDDEQHKRSIYLYGAVSILTYRADFVLELDFFRKLAVECDGHDFHDRTKQQAAYDRARDRELLAIGIPTVRFTGSEIHHSAERCAQEAYRCLFSLPNVHALARGGWDEAMCFVEQYAERTAERKVEEHW